jgi:anti-sigma regulatory factor (Ser/Thr protein kinase)
MSSLSIENIEWFIEYISNNHKIDLTKFDNFIDPSIWAILKSKLLLDTNKLEIMPFVSGSKSHQYLMKILGKSTSDTTLPLERFNSDNRDESDQFAENFIKLIDIEDEDPKKYAQYIVRELLTNTIDHARSTTDVVCCAQKFPKIKEIEIIIIDTGLGFHKTISRKYSEISSNKEAIKKALEKGVTGTTESKMYYRMYGQLKNAGLGLYVISEMVKYYNGKLFIISKNGSLTQQGNSIKSKSLNHEWNGSIVIVRLHYDKLNYTFSEFMKYITQDRQSNNSDIF